MGKSLKEYAKKNKIKYFMISFTDIFGAQRAKLVPAQVISEMEKEGAGFAGFATWLDMTPAHPDMLAIPDPRRHQIRLQHARLRPPRRGRRRAILDRDRLG